MPLPKVSEKTRNQVIREFNDFGDVHDYLDGISNRLLEVNPIIAKTINNIVLAQSYDMDLAINMGVYGFMVYRVLELTLGQYGIPLVSESIDVPTQLDFFTSVKYRLDLVDRLMEQNEEIIKLWAGFNPNLDESKKAQALLVGLYVYRFIESQFESDQMKKSFAP